MIIVSIVSTSKRDLRPISIYFYMLGPEPYAESMKIVRKPAGKTAILKCGFGIRNFLWSDKNLASITDGTWYKGPRRIVWSKRMSPRTRQKGKARFVDKIIFSYVSFSQPTVSLHNKLLDKIIFKVPAIKLVNDFAI